MGGVEVVMNGFNWLWVGSTHVEHVARGLSRGGNEDERAGATRSGRGVCGGSRARLQEDRTPISMK